MSGVEISKDLSGSFRNNIVPLLDGSMLGNALMIYCLDGMMPESQDSNCDPFGRIRYSYRMLSTGSAVATLNDFHMMVTIASMKIDMTG